MKKQLMLALSLATLTASAADTYGVEVFHDGSEVAKGQMVDMYTGAAGAARVLDDVTNASLTTGLVEVDGDLNVCGTTIQLQHGKWCVGVPTYVAAK